MMIVRNPRGAGVTRWTPAAALALLVVADVGCHHATPAVAGAAVPVYREPMQWLVYRNPLVRVLDVRIPPGDTTAYHGHGAPMVGIALQAPTPYVFTNWSPPLPSTHRAANVDPGPLHYVVAEWLARSGREAPALPTDETRELIEESPELRVYRIALEPRASTWPHTHMGPGLVVLGTGGSLQDDGGPRARGGSGAGSWSWREGPYRHRLRNAGPTKIVVYEIDWR